MLKIVKNNDSNYEFWNDEKLLLTSDNLDGIVLKKIEVNRLYERGQISIKSEKRIDSIVNWIMFL